MLGLLETLIKKSSTNVTNYLNIKNKITYLDNYSSDSEVVKINLEEREEEAKLKFDNVFLLNVLEHIYNYKNCLNNCYLILNEKGIFMVQHHFSLEYISHQMIISDLPNKAY